LSAALAVALGLSALAILVWLLTLTTLANLTGSDAAGNGLAQAYAAIELIFLWVLLAAVAILTFVKVGIETLAALAAYLLIPASGVVALMTIGLLAEPDVPPYLWPIVIPALIPPLIIGYCVTLPRLEAKPARLAALVLWSAVVAISLSYWPLNQSREAAEAREAAAQQKYDADLAKLAPDAPLWAWTPFLATRNDLKQDELVYRIRKLGRRQSDAEIMLDRGDFPLGFLAAFDLTPTPSLCDKARRLLLNRVGLLVLATPQSKPYADIAEQVSDAVSAMDWLVGMGCSCDKESLAWETMAKAYRDTNFDVYRLAELRDPKELGRLLRDQSQ
jgi:hypothetical protein